MKHYAGLDVSVKETSICIVEEAGRIRREMKVVSHPEDPKIRDEKLWDSKKPRFLMKMSPIYF